MEPLCISGMCKIDSVVFYLQFSLRAHPQDNEHRDVTKEKLFAQPTDYTQEALKYAMD